jgi:hypothetical protein
VSPQPPIPYNDPKPTHAILTTGQTEFPTPPPSGRKNQHHHRPTLTTIGHGKFRYNGTYQDIFGLVEQALTECRVKITESSFSRGITVGKCGYGINVFGITITAIYYSAGPEATNIELSANLTDALDTFGVCDKKTKEISDRLDSLVAAVPAGNPPNQPPPRPEFPCEFDAHNSSNAPSYQQREGPSFRGKAITGCCLCFGGLCAPITSVAGLILCSQALTWMATSNNQSGKTWAIVGLIVGLIGLIPWAVYFLSLLGSP